MTDRNEQGPAAFFLRRAGLIVLLFTFAHSYFGVGSIKNAFSAMPALARVLAAAYGSGWVALWAGGILLVMTRPIGSAVAKSGALLSSATFLAGYGIFGLTFDRESAVFALSQPLSGLFLFFLLTMMQRETSRSPSAPLRWHLPLVGAAMPWLAAVIHHLAAHAPFARPAGLGIFIGLFMTAWCALPFGALMLALSVLRSRGWRMTVCAFTGTAAASLYTYGLIWAQGFNAFLLALLPPVVFVGQAAGLVVGMVLERKGNLRKA